MIFRKKWDKKFVSAVGVRNFASVLRKPHRLVKVLVLR